ncbi:unnamed protein product [Polarella glacialis]|uniref:Lipid-binding serum glycoprotein C-terminal domain-containing protein n=1 Tax=Polarella glacialis TaxID=89957 RepID=A0A813M4K1_POLGL|nr:unnamed protein product [Polarella glacialis]
MASMSSVLLGLGLLLLAASGHAQNPSSQNCASENEEDVASVLQVHSASSTSSRRRSEVMLPSPGCGLAGNSPCSDTYPPSYAGVCGELGNNEGPALGAAVTPPTNTACGCNTLCTQTEGCAAWTFYAGSYADSYGGGDSCQLRSALKGMVYNCGSDQQQCVSAPRECGQPGNNAGLGLGSTVNTAGPCGCKQLCVTTTGCAGWTFYAAEYVQAYGGGMNCQLYSFITTTLNNCGGSLGGAAQLCVSAANPSPPPPPPPIACGAINAWLTQTGLTYMNDVMFPMMTYWITNGVNEALPGITSFSENAMIAADLVGYHVSNVHVWDFGISSLNVEFAPGQGLLFSMSGLTLQAFCTVGGHATIVGTSGWLSLGIDSGSYCQFLAEPSITPGGEFTLSFKEASCQMPIDESFHANWYDDISVFNWGVTVGIKSALKSMTQMVVNKVLQGVTADFGTSLSPDYPTMAKTSSVTAINLTAVDAVTSNDFMLMAVSGAPLSDVPGVTYAPLQCSPTSGNPAPPEDASGRAGMFGFSLREFAVNGQLSVMYSSGLLQIMLPSSETGLTTTFGGDGSAIAPGLRTQYPQAMPVNAEISAMQVPFVNLTDGAMTAMAMLLFNFSAVHPSSGSITPVFAISVPMELQVEVTSSGQTLAAQVSVLKLTPLQTVSSSVGPLTLELANPAIDEFVNKFVVPAINSSPAMNVAVPEPLSSTQLLFEQGAMTFLSDISLGGRWTASTTTTTTPAPASCSSSGECSVSSTSPSFCWGGDGPQPCFSCRQVKCSQQGRRRRNNQCTCGSR